MGLRISESRNVAAGGVTIAQQWTATTSVCLPARALHASGLGSGVPLSSDCWANPLALTRCTSIGMMAVGQGKSVADPF